MSRNSPSYKITPIGDIFFIVLEGVWTVQIDLAYISELFEILEKRRTRDWGICVDMTNWTFPKEVFDSPFKSKIALKRRNQIGESWITKSTTQGEELMVFFDNCSFKPQRFAKLADAIAHLQALGLSCPSHDIIKSIIN
ncbi:hypothetical protein [Aliiglaciecola lipolytica]|nr:hypothetical protein [Aliiglaciecola lipolytica]